jgi:hypothetical protein
MFESSKTAEMMVGPPAAPATSTTLPSGPVTMVGAIGKAFACRMRSAFPCFALHETEAVCGARHRSEVVHLVIENRASALHVTPDPYHQLIVVVIATVSPGASTTEVRGVRAARRTGGDLGRRRRAIKGAMVPR